MPPIVAGTTIDDRYVILRLLGEGGIGCVYQAREIALERVIAVKVLHPTLVGIDEVRTRFNRESVLLSKLAHPNLLVFHRFGIWNHNQPYIAMEYLPGRSLRNELTESGAMPWTLVLRIAMQVCDGMNAAHAAGIVHRDLKPENIMLVGNSGAESVKIVDFGLGALLGDEQVQRLTHTGELVGTVSYMSPEQCTGLKADHRADIYAFGCILFEMLAGYPPFSGSNPISIMKKHCQEPAPDIGLSDVELPVGLAGIVGRSLQKEPSQRYESMLEMKQDLDSVLSGRGSSVGRRPKQVGSMASRDTIIAVSGSVVFIVLMIILVIVFVK